MITEFTMAYIADKHPTQQDALLETYVLNDQEYSTAHPCYKALEFL